MGADVSQMTDVNKTVKMTGKRGEAQECGLEEFLMPCGPSFHRQSPSTHLLIKLIRGVEDSRLCRLILRNNRYLTCVQ